MTKLKKTQSNESLKKAIAFLGLDMTMEQLGNKLNYSKAAVSKYLGDFPPSKAFLLKFEEVFEIDLKNFESTNLTLSIEDGYESFNEPNNKDAMTESEFLKELVNELRERVVDLKESLENEKQSKIYFKNEYELLKTQNSSKREDDLITNQTKD